MNLRLRARVQSVAPERATLKSDAVAGLPVAVGGVPDGMAAAVLAGVNPVYGLYASIAGPIAGGLSSSTQLMVITTTSAAAWPPAPASPTCRSPTGPTVLVLLTAWRALMMIAAGLLRLGRYTRFVSLSVMIGFLTGVAVNIVLGQLPDLTGAEVDGLGRGRQGLGCAHATRPRSTWPSLLVGLVALAIVAGAGPHPAGAVRRALRPGGADGGVARGGQRRRVQDNGKIPSGIPLPHLPDPSVSASTCSRGPPPSPCWCWCRGPAWRSRRRTPTASRRASTATSWPQGIGNIASAIFRGQPVGGSVGQTALNLAAGARSRWAPIFAGIWMLRDPGAVLRDRRQGRASRRWPAS